MPTYEDYIGAIEDLRLKLRVDERLEDTKIERTKRDAIACSKEIVANLKKIKKFIAANE